MYDINRSIGELQPESFEYASESIGETGFLAEWESPFSEAEEMELAAELLAVNNEAELEQFIGNLFKKAWSGIKSVGSKFIRPLGGVLKTVAKTALPYLATAAGTFFGGPAGGAIAGKLGSMVSQALEAETAATAAVDRDLEKCRQFVRMAGKAAKAAALAPPGADPVAVAKKSLAVSAQQKIAKGTAALRAEGISGKQPPLAGFGSGAATRTASPGSPGPGRQAQTMAGGIPPAATAAATGKPSVPAGFGPGAATRKPSPGAGPQAVARGAAPVRASAGTGRPTGQANAPLRYEPTAAARNTAVASAQPRPATGATALQGTGGRCSNSHFGSETVKVFVSGPQNGSWRP